MYKKPDYSNIKNNYMHLTNYSLNKHSTNFIAPGDDFNADNMASKRSLSNIYNNI